MTHSDVPLDLALLRIIANDCCAWHVCCLACCMSLVGKPFDTSLYWVCCCKRARLQLVIATTYCILYSVYLQKFDYLLRIQHILKGGGGGEKGRTILKKISTGCREWCRFASRLRIPKSCTVLSICMGSLLFLQLGQKSSNSSNAVGSIAVCNSFLCKIP